MAEQVQAQLDKKAKLDPSMQGRPAWRAGGGPTGPQSSVTTQKPLFDKTNIRSKVDTGLQKAPSSLADNQA